MTEESLIKIGKLAVEEREAFANWITSNDNKLKAAWWRAQDAVFTAVAESKP